MVFDIYIYGLIINFRINISLLEFCFMLQIYLGNVQIGILKVTMNNWIFYFFSFKLIAYQRQIILILSVHDWNGIL